ncbi:hypothetical protein LINGRAHAP2_LOCUS26288 [Linum grandiflorum]
MQKPAEDRKTKQTKKPNPFSRFLLAIVFSFFVACNFSIALPLDSRQTQQSESHQFKWALCLGTCLHLTPTTSANFDPPILPIHPYSY